MIRIKNYMEEIVERVVDRALSGLNICKCERCRADIIAISLNELPTKYVVTREGESYLKMNLLKTQFEVDIIKTIAKAAETVGKAPRH